MQKLLRCAGVTTDLSMLAGLALTDPAHTPPTISYFPAHSLPTLAGPRFAALFDARPDWTLTDITPYVR